MRLPEKSLPLDCHPASRVAKIKQRATSSKFTPPSNCQLSLRFYGEASSTIPATPYDDLRRERRDGTVIPFQRETSSLSWSRGYQRELSPSVHCSRRAQKRSRARFRSVRARIHYPWLCVHRRERKTRFHARNCLVTRSRFVMAPLRLRGLTTIGTDVRICCVRARVCVCMHRWCGERRGKSRGERNRGDRSTSTNSRELDRGWEN